MQKKDRGFLIRPINPGFLMMRLIASGRIKNPRSFPAHRCSALIILFLLLLTVCSFGQAVDVTMSVNRPFMLAGETATLRVFGRIKTALQPTSDRVFSWYVDVTNNKPGAVRVDWNTMVMQSSDNTQGFFSSGVNEGANNRRGIYNTFLNLSGAGKSSPVELFNVRLTALEEGAAVITVAAGTGQPNISYDFIVAPSSGTTPYTGGDYTQASLTVSTVPEFVTPSKLVDLAASGRRLEYPTVTGFNHRVETSTDLSTWTNIAGFFNSGLYTDATALPAVRRKYYRVRLIR